MRLLIAILTYARPDSLRLLLDSIGRMHGSGPDPVDLTISQDGGGHAACGEIMRAFPWRHGVRRLVFHTENLGLREHVLRTGDLVEGYDALIMLEEDLIVSPWMLEYATAALAASENWSDLAQIALYSPGIAEYYGLPFRAVRCGGDAWFGRIPCSWGQCWTRRQWLDFRAWMQGHPAPRALEDIGHPAAQWDDQSWKRIFFEYLLDRSRWVMYPHTALTTNRGVPGVHSEEGKPYYHAPLEVERLPWRFTDPRASRACYDEWFEPCPHVLDALPAATDAAPIVCDLYGQRPLPRDGRGWLLSTRHCRHPRQSFLDELAPREMNLRLGLETRPGRGGIHLGYAQDFDPSPASLTFYIRHAPPKLTKEIRNRERNAVERVVQSRCPWHRLSLKMKHLLRMPFRAGL